MCIHAKYLAGSLQSQLDSVSFGEAGGGPGSYLVTKQRSYLNINPKNLGLSIIFTIFFEHRALCFISTASWVVIFHSCAEIDSNITAK